MKKSVCILFVYLFASGLSSEQIDGPANIRSEPDSPIICSLYDNSFVEINFYKSKKYKTGYSILFYFKINSLQINNRKMQKGDKIINESNEVVGEFESDFSLNNLSEWYFGKNKNQEYSGVMEAYTHKNNLKFILENKINAVIGNMHYGFENYSDIIKYNRFVSYREFSELGSLYRIYLKSDNEWSPVSPSPRIFLVFKDMKLYGYLLNGGYKKIENKINPVDNKILSIISYRP